MTRTLLAVFAHPDDETFAIAGTLARLHAEGVHTVLHVATDGAAGRASGLTVRDPAELARVRRSELLRAAAVLGVGRVVAPRRPDGGLPDEPEAELIAEVEATIRLVRPDVVVTFGPEGGPNQHRDHRVMSRVATAAFERTGIAARLLYVTWSAPIRDAFGVAGLPVGCRVHVAPWVPAKLRAFEEHRSQWVHRDRFMFTVADYEEFALGGGAPCRDDDPFG